MQPVQRDVLPDRGRHARPNYLCYPPTPHSPHRRWETRRVCTIFHVQPSAAMRGDEERGARVAAVVDQDGGGARGRAARARINFPDPEFISSISARAHTHSGHALSWPAAKRTLVFHLWPASAPQDRAVVLAAASSRPLVISAGTFRPRLDFRMTRSCSSAPRISRLPPPHSSVLPPFFAFFFTPHPAAAAERVGVTDRLAES